MALNFSTLRLPVNEQVVDPESGKMREEWRLFFNQLNGRLNSAVGLGDVFGPASAAAGNLPAFGDTTGKVLADSGVAAAEVLTDGDIGSDVQAYADNLDGWSIVSPADYYNSAGVDAAISAYAQPLDGDLTAIAGLAKTDGGFIVGNGAAWVLETGNTARTSLGLGTGDLPTFAGLVIDDPAIAVKLHLRGSGAAGIELGRVDGTASTPYIDFHAGATVVDYDARIIAQTGTGSSGGGTLDVQCGAFLLNGSPIGLALSVASAQATTSGTAVDFTGIASGAERITIMLDEVSLNGSDQILVQIGDSGGIETSGYVSGSGNRGATSTSTAGFVIRVASSTAAVSGIMTLERVSGNTWVSSHAVNTASGTEVCNGGGRKTLSATLDRVRLTSSGGNSLDGGQANLSVG